MTSAFHQLREFILHRMQMQHVYQPVMIKTLLQHGGRATLRDIAAAFLAYDESQLEYYEQITKAMPGRVLGRHGITDRNRDGYCLKVDPDGCTAEEVEELIRLCDEAVQSHLSERGEQVYRHRRLALAYVPGSMRYEVLRRAGGRCELCGISKDEAPLDIDHIQPRKFGGKTVPENLQALCARCNTIKGARDNTDFRGMADAYQHRVKGCPFCELLKDRVVEANTLAVVIRDGFPVTPLHSLVIPHRHVATYFHLFEPERRAIERLLDGARKDLLTRDPTIQGFNVGFNAGESAGQTVMHCHVHLIPRRKGDTVNPRGGIRGVIPEKQNY